MARFSGKVGFVSSTPASAGVHTEVTTERPYYGDVLRAMQRLERGDGLNDNIVVNNQISIVADPYAYENFFAIRYVWWAGTKWKVTHVEVLRPRLLMTIGEVYNG